MSATFDPELDEKVRNGIEEILAGVHPDPLPPVVGALATAASTVSELLQEPFADGAVPDAAIEECAAVDWRVGMAAVGLLRALPALERAEHRLAHRPESLRREVTGWSMLSNLAMHGLGASTDALDPLAPLMAIAEVEQLENELAVAAAEDLGADAPMLEDLLDCASGR
jgi:hypothetical protein